MIAYLKSTLKLPAIGWIVDTGTYLGIGNSVINKNLTIAGLDRKFIPYTGIGTYSGNSYSVNPVIYDGVTTGSNLMLTGNNCMLQMQYFPIRNTSATYLQSIAKPGGWQTFCYGNYSPSFASTQGRTNGNTYIIIGNEFSQVLADGTLLTLNTAIELTTVTGAQSNCHLTIIAENGNYFVGLENINGAYVANTISSQANFRFFFINKITWIFTTAAYPNSKQYWYSAPKFMGITSDNKVLIACYPVPSTGTSGGVYGTLYYYSCDLNLNTFSQSTTGTLIHNLNTVTTCSVPSSWSTEISDTTKNKYYIANCNSVAATATTISRIIIPKSLRNKITDNTITDPPMGNCSATAFSTTTNIITAKNDFVINQAITFSVAFGNIAIGIIYYVSATNLTSTGFSVSITNGGSVLTLTGTTGAITSFITCVPTICTTAGVFTPIPNPNSAPTTNTSTGTAACIYLNQQAANSKEYVVALTMGYANITGTGGYANIVACSNGCTPANHSLTVFQIDPTNSANLIYKSAITGYNNFGLANPVFNFNASADNTIFVLSNELQFVILTWDVSTESYSYSRVYSILDGIGRISLDTTNQLWIHSNTNSNVYLYTLNNNFNVEITSNNTNNVNSLDYSGSNLTQNVLINSYNTTSPSWRYSTQFVGGYLNASTNTGLALGTSNFTIEFWTYCITTPNIVFFDGRPATTNGVYTTISTDANSQLYITTSGVSLISQVAGGKLTTNTWYHIALVKNSGSTKLYLNGVQIGVTATDTNTYLIGANRPTIGGSGYTAGALPLNGYISNLRVTNTAVYTTTFTPSTTPLTAITGTRLLTCQSSTINDNSSNNNTIVQNGILSPSIFIPFAQATATRQTKTVGLSVSGPATFTATGSTSTSITTSTTTDTIVGLTITGTGSVTVTPTSVV